MQPAIAVVVLMAAVLAPVAPAGAAAIRSDAQALQVLARACPPPTGRMSNDCARDQATAQSYLRDHRSPEHLRELLHHRLPAVVIGGLHACAQADGCLHDEDIRNALTHRSGYVRAAVLNVVSERWPAERQRPVMQSLLTDAAAASPDNIDSVADRALRWLQVLDQRSATAVATTTEAETLRLHRQHPGESARNSTLRAAFFAPARRQPPAHVSLKAAAQQLALSSRHSLSPTLQDVHGKAALARLLQSRDVAALTALTHDRTALVRITALDALTPLIEPAALVDPALRAAADGAEWQVPQEGCVITGTVDDNDVFQSKVPTIDAAPIVADTVAHYLDAPSAQALYSRASPRLQASLREAGKSDALLRDALAEPLRALADQGDSSTLLALAQLADYSDADRTRILNQLEAHPVVALQALRGDTDARVLSALQQWWRTQAPQPCSYFQECESGHGTGSEYVEYFTTLASLGDAAQPLIEQVFTQAMDEPHRRYHVRELLRHASATQRAQLEQQRHLTDYERLRALERSDPAAAIRLARRLLQHLDAIQNSAPHTTNQAFVSRHATTTGEPVLVNDSSGLPALLQSAIWILAQAKADDLDALLLDGLDRSAACCVAPFATAVAMKQLPQARERLITRFAAAQQEFELIALADAIVHYDDAPLTQRLLAHWSDRAAQFRPEVDQALQHALQAHRLRRQVFPGVR